MVPNCPRTSPNVCRPARCIAADGRASLLARNVGVCPTCHLNFASDAAFDAHRVGPYGPERHCVVAEAPKFKVKVKGLPRVGLTPCL
jgi:hypothetical protein